MTKSHVMDLNKVKLLKISYLETLKNKNKTHTQHTHTLYPSKYKNLKTIQTRSSVIEIYQLSLANCCFWKCLIKCQQKFL